jgi:hypothetical protein
MLSGVYNLYARVGIGGRTRGNVVLVAYQIIIIPGSTRSSRPLHMDVLDLKYEKKRREEHTSLLGAIGTKWTIAGDA